MMKTVKISISGMSCGHCVRSVATELAKLNRVTINAVNVGSAEISIDENVVTEQTVRTAVEAAGFAVNDIQM
jgi:copper chaperone